jgi:hypothetical protein
MCGGSVERRRDGELGEGAREPAVREQPLADRGAREAQQRRALVSRQFGAGLERHGEKATDAYETECSASPVRRAEVS